MERTTALETVQKIGQKVLLQGWVDVKRDHGKITFIELRDHTGQVQCVGFQKMGELTPETVVEIKGEVKRRPDQLVNPKMATGTVEIDVETYEVINKALPLPFPVQGDGKNISEEIRLKYRYVDLRRERMRNIMKLRSDYSFALRKALNERGFTEVETPILSKATMEGARDFLVPSRFQPGKFYALPQSPQQYKQLLMAAGVYRYYQFARCFRDEDLRADRGFEFTQLDLEMSYVNRDEVIQTVSAIVKDSVKAVGGTLNSEDFPVITYREALKRFGADKFDLRTEAEKQSGTLAFAWVVDFPMFKKVDRKDAAETRDSKSGWTFTHNPFGSPKQEHLEWHLKGEHIDEILTDQYDLVCNGYEVGGGSIRAHNPEVLKATYRIMGYDEKATQASIGHMVEALSYGTPPHGGLALGLDRLIMLLSHEDSLKETIAFPMTSTGRTAVMDAPTEIGEEQLAELGLKRAKKVYASPYEHILDLLTFNHVSYTEFQHENTLSSERVASLRNTTLHQGAKSLVLKMKDQHILYVLPADLKVDFKALSQALAVKHIELAPRESVEKETGLPPGSIPPFGSVINLPTFVDSRMEENQEIAFNAARLDRSIKMSYEDYLKLEKPTVINLA